MGMTFGGEDGFYKIPQRITSQTVDCENINLNTN